MDDGTKKFNKKLIRGKDDKKKLFPHTKVGFLVKLLVHKSNNSTSKGVWASLWNILMTGAKRM